MYICMLFYTTVPYSRCQVKQKVRSISFELVDKRVYVPYWSWCWWHCTGQIIEWLLSPVLEHEPGISIKDPLLDWLPPVDCSWPIFILLYGSPCVRIDFSCSISGCVSSIVIRFCLYVLGQVSLYFFYAG